MLKENNGVEIGNDGSFAENAAMAVGDTTVVMLRVDNVMNNDRLTLGEADVTTKRKKRICRSLWLFRVVKWLGRMLTILRMIGM